VRTAAGYSSALSSRELAGGEELGGYRIVECRGPSTPDRDPHGFRMAAVVYEADEISTGRSVLLKVFDPEPPAEESFVDRFLCEGRRVAAFQHPNVTAVYDVGVERGRLYLAEEDLEGKTLSRLLRSGGLSATQASALLGPIADALDAAHDAGLVHGEVRPETISISSDGVPRLAAFCVAKSVAGVRAGNVDCASPELLCDQPLTAAADVYSLTAVLYHCLTGEQPSSEIARRVATTFKYAPSLDRFEPASPELDRVIACGLATDPTERYGRARELIGQAEEALNGLPAELLERVPTFVPVRQEDDLPPARASLAPRRSIGLRSAAGALIALLAALAVAAIAAVLAASGPKHSAPDLGPRLAAVGPLTVRYDGGWRAASGPVTGTFAVTASNGRAQPLALTSGFATVAAGVLRQSALVPGDVPPQLVSRYGQPVDAGVALIAGHAAGRYEWPLTEGSSLVALVLPTTGSDIALICAAGAPTEVALSACEEIAGETQVSGTAIIPPGPDSHVEAALSRDLAPIAGAVDALHGLAGGTLAARSLIAANVARTARDAESSLAGVNAPARNGDALADLRRALSAEEAGFAALASDAAGGNRTAYDAARTRVVAAGELVTAAEASLTREGFKLPPLLTPPLAAAPAATPPPNHRSGSAPSVGDSTVAPSTASDGVVRSAPEVHSSPLPSEHESTPATPSPKVVVVPTGSGGSESSPVVVVPTG
jgi:hypothetical protein